MPVEAIHVAIETILSRGGFGLSIATLKLISFGLLWLAGRSPCAYKKLRERGNFRRVSGELRKNWTGRRRGGGFEPPRHFRFTIVQRCTSPRGNALVALFD